MSHLSVNLYCTFRWYSYYDFMFVRETLSEVLNLKKIVFVYSVNSTKYTIFSKSYYIHDLVIQENFKKKLFLVTK